MYNIYLLTGLRTKYVYQEKTTFIDKDFVTNFLHFYSIYNYNIIRVSIIILATLFLSFYFLHCTQVQYCFFFVLISKNNVRGMQ